MTESKKTEEELSVEQSFARLEEILGKMEREDTGLEESFRLYEEGIKLLRRAEGSVDRVEKNLRVLSGAEPEGSGRRDG